jgi:hypothetical protein
MAEEEEKYKYECEACGRVDECPEEEAYQAGWDYPPFVGAWGIVSPRTCPNCLIDQSAYWYLLNRQENDPIPENHVKTLLRILEEKGPSLVTA